MAGGCFAGVADRARVAIVASDAVEQAALALGSHARLSRAGIIIIAISILSAVAAAADDGLERAFARGRVTTVRRARVAVIAGHGVGAYAQAALASICNCAGISIAARRSRVAGA